MIITESQLRKIIQEETQAVLHEQIIREFQQGILEEGVKDVLQKLIKKHGQKAVMAAVMGSMALGGVAPAFAGQRGAVTSDMQRQMQVMQQAREDAAEQRAAREEARDELADQLVQTIDLTGDLGETEIDLTSLERQLIRAKSMAAATGSSPRIDADWAWDILEQTLGPEAYRQLVSDANQGGARSEAMQQIRGAVNAITGAMITMTRAPIGS